MQNAPRSKVAKAITVTAMMCGGKTLPPEVVDAYIDRLARYSEDAIVGALTRCRDEVKGHLAMRDIIERISDGRPSPEEAWAMIPKSEDESVVWTDDIAAASASVMDMSDRVAARMAFLDTYKRLTRESRTEGKPIKFFLSAGRDKAGRVAATNKAVALGRLTPGEAMRLTPALPAPPEPAQTRQLPSPDDDNGEYATPEERAGLTAKYRALGVSKCV